MSEPNETDGFDLSNLALELRDEDPEPVIPLTERFKWARQRLEGMLNDIDSENKREWSSRQEIQSHTRGNRDSEAPRNQD